VAGLAITSLAGAGHLSAQLTPAGVYRSRTVALELTADRYASVSARDGARSIWTYRVARDTIAFRDEGGHAACSGPTGLYLWRLHADSLWFRLVSDPCESRRTLLAMGWTRVAPAFAQELDAIVITAERQAQDVQRAPVAITVLSGEEARDAGVARPQDLTYLVPGLQVGSLAGGSAMLYMRGVGNFAGVSLQDPTITFNFDGVYIARPTSTGGLYFDLERVEVLKGPQGTLYGRNATGGAVNVLPRRPQLQVVTGEAVAEYGEHNTLRLDGALNAPLGDRAAIRVAGQRLRHDAYMKDGTDDQDDWAGRLSIRLEPTDALSLRLGVDYYDQRGHGPGATPLALDRDGRFGVASPEGGTYYAGQRVTIAGRNLIAVPALQRASNQHWGVNATLEWRTGLGALTLVPASRTSDLDALNTQVGNLFTLQEQSRQTSLEARMASNPHSRLHTLVGGFYFDEAIDLFTRPYNQFNFSLLRPSTTTTSAAAFGRVTWDITHRFRVTGGLRYTHEDKEFRGTFESFSRICPPVPSASCPNAQPFPVDIMVSPLVFAPDSLSAAPVFNPVDGTLTTGFRIFADETATFSRATWRAAAEYDVAEQVFLYASYETGFKSGGFFASNDSQVYQPEHVGALTLGAKTRLFDSRLRANLELFHWSYKDQQVSKLSLDSRGVTSLRTENIGRATIRGIEAELEYLVATNTQLSANLHYLDAVYDSYTYVTFGPPVTGCPVSPLGQNQFQVDCSGRRAPYAPEWTMALGADRAFPLRGGASLLARARTRYQSETLVGLDFLPQQQQDGYWMVDASLTFAASKNRYSVGVFVQNVTDHTVVSNTFVVPFSTFAVGVLRPPRTFGVRASTGFGRVRER
jgi:iron complex outermembrane receptor protein